MDGSSTPTEWEDAPQTISLAQAVRSPEEANRNGSNGWTAMAPPNVEQQTGIAPAPWNNTGMVQYALVPVPISAMQHNMDASNYVSYGCYPQQSQQQMAVMQGNNGQWVQVAAPYAPQPTYGCPMNAAPDAGSTELLLGIQG